MKIKEIFKKYYIIDFVLIIGVIGILVFLIIFSILTQIIFQKINVSSDDLGNIINEIKQDNGILTVQTKDKEYTLWYNSKGNVFVTDRDKYSIFLNDYSDIIQQTAQEIKNSKQIDKSSLIELELQNSNTKTTIKYSTDKEQKRLEIIKKSDDNYIVSLYTIDENKEYLEWYFNGYTKGVYWEEPEDVSKNSLSSMQEKLKELLHNTISDYINSGFSDELYNQTIKQIQNKGFGVHTNFKTAIDTKITGKESISLFAYIMQYGLEKGYITSSNQTLYGGNLK